jgi:carbonic anhydrase/acetyltransferase-like protein (isoleucine patch superfamily)
MLIEHEGKRPRIDPSARIAPTAVICGDVTIGADTSVGFGAVLTAESGSVTVGKSCIVMENAVIRGTRRHPATIADHVLIGPHAMLSGCRVAESAFLATGCAIFNGADIGARAEVRIRGTVHLATRLADDSVVPIGWVAVGDPAEILPPDRHDEIWRLQEPLNFPKFVFGVKRPPPGSTNMPEITGRYLGLLHRHRGDRIIDETL